MNSFDTSRIRSTTTFEPSKRVRDQQSSVRFGSTSLIASSPTKPPTRSHWTPLPLSHVPTRPLLIRSTGPPHALVSSFRVPYCLASFASNPLSESTPSPSTTMTLSHGHGQTITKPFSPVHIPSNLSRTPLPFRFPPTPIGLLLYAGTFDWLVFPLRFSGQWTSSVASGWDRLSICRTREVF
jgi:hypothetical protein